MPPRRALLDWLLEAAALVALIAMGVILFEYTRRLPVRGPRVGGQATLGVLMLFNAGIYILLTAASRYQSMIGVLFEIDRTRPEVRALLLRLTIVLKTVLMVLLAWLLWMIVNTPLGRTKGLGPGYFALLVIGTSAPAIWYGRKLWRYRK